MNRTEYLQLIELLETGLRDAGIPDLSDPTLYAERDPESGELRQRHPRDDLVELLRALERVFAVTDRRTYHSALRSINESLEEPSVVSAVIIPFDNDSEPFSLEEGLPDLGSVRNRLFELINGILADPEPNGEVNR